MCNRLYNLDYLLVIVASFVTIPIINDDSNTGHYALTVIEGEDALDPAHSSLGSQYELPQDRLTIAFWFSPGRCPYVVIAVVAL